MKEKIYSFLCLLFIIAAIALTLFMILKSKF